jgi:hypothetical protein
VSILTWATILGSRLTLGADLRVRVFGRADLRTNPGYVKWPGPYVRTVKTASGATAVQIVYSSHRGSRDIEHIGSARGDAELELLKAVAR